ncbi:HNH endonuclease [Draconibacterium halophilum]|uniref:HNH endonuclease n=1 Tax=Draconibacterium halophilum TaxID=2706887 RepID=UPI0037438305
MTVIDYSTVNVKYTDLGKRRKPMARWSMKVKRRDRSVCKVCGSNEDLDAHHIMRVSCYPHWKYCIDNGITLCKQCHMKADEGLLSISFLLNISDTGSF